MNWNIYFQAFTVRTWRKRLSNLNTFLTPHIYWGIHITICVNYNQHSLDQTKIRQALFNLLRNAQESIQHTHGRILFSASVVPDGVQITISDNGCGMTEDQIENAFRPFVTYKPGGTGLGLAVTRQIIEAHQGTLCVESTPKEGTSFYIFLPG